LVVLVLKTELMKIREMCPLGVYALGSSQPLLQPFYLRKYIHFTVYS
jgi:hypothetical protein